MTTYQDRMKPYVNFKNTSQLDEEVTKFRKNVGYELSKAENDFIDYMKQYSVRYTGVFYQKIKTISEKFGKSVATVKRYLSKFVSLGILKRIPLMREKQGGKGASIYQFQFFKSQNEPSNMSHRSTENNASKPCGSKAQEDAPKNKPFYSLNNNLKDISYQQAETRVFSNKIEKETENKKPSLRTRISHQLKARGLDKSLLNELAMIAYSNIKNTVKVDSSIPRDYLENLAYRKFLSVVDNPRTQSLFGLFTHELQKTFNKLIGKSDEQSEVELNAKLGPIRPVPQFMIDNETDPVVKARYIKNNEIAKVQREEMLTRKGKKVGVVPDWLIKQKEEEAKAEAERIAAKKIEEENSPKIDFEAERRRLLSLLND